ncbi:hypothetical protein LIER_07884 [Lithospermum erythrorhizon]|uniref:Uncharacterized protein n=1 Tax=Lithospermum erythrorhizon TaxID=34254 RepID=A0AAV3P9V5_LITER
MGLLQGHHALGPLFPSPSQFVPKPTEPPKISSPVKPPLLLRQMRHRRRNLEVEQLWKRKGNSKTCTAALVPLLLLLLGIMESLMQVIHEWRLLQIHDAFGLTEADIGDEREKYFDLSIVVMGELSNVSDAMMPKEESVRSCLRWCIGNESDCGFVIVNDLSRVLAKG